METRVFKINENVQEDNIIKEPAEIIKNGGLVAIPTETVYGLAGDGLNPRAIEKIFKAKNRPMDNPLILHISKIDQIYDLVENLDPDHKKFLEKVWPGPLTVVLKRSPRVPDEVTGGLDTVAIRLPKNEITRKLIDLVGSPLAAPSANISGRPSPTRAHDVLRDLDGRIEGIIDGGDSNIGIESTVLDLTEDPPKILRPGYYTQEMLEEYFPKVQMDAFLKDSSTTPKSPGQKYRHYSPKARVQVVLGYDEKFVEYAKEVLEKNPNTGLMVFDHLVGNFKDWGNIISIGNREDLSQMSHILFKSFRLMDDNKVELILVQGVEEEGFGLSIMNRLKKASGNNIRRV